MRCRARPAGRISLASKLETDGVGMTYSRRPILGDWVAAVPANCRLAHRVEDAHSGRGRLRHFDHRPGMTLVEKIDEGPARGIALLPDLPAVAERPFALCLVILGPARPVLHPLMPGREEIAIEAWRIATLLDQFELYIPRIC